MEFRTRMDDLIREHAALAPEARWFVVGGAVRDALLGRATTDVDFAVVGIEAPSLEKFLRERGEVNLVGNAFGVFKFRPRESDASYDIALPRREHPAGTGGYRDVETQSDPRLPIEEDLARRDFTVNAMAWDLAAARLIDPYRGRADIEKKLLRAVGNPSERFAEDLTRLLRGLRLAVQLGFEIERETWSAMQALMPRIAEKRDGRRIVPEELAARELLKSLAADPVRAAMMWEDGGALKALAPELEGWAERIEAAMKRLEKEDVRRVLDGKAVPEPVVLGSCFAFLGPDPAAALAERLKLASAGFDVDAGLVRRLASGDLALYKELGAKPPLSGERVMELLGLPAGPAVGELLDRLILEAAAGRIAGPEDAEAWLKRVPPPLR